MLDLVSIIKEARKMDTIAALAEETHQPASVVKDISNEQYMRLKQMVRSPITSFRDSANKGRSRETDTDRTSLGLV
jgi:hypothetical protein